MRLMPRPMADRSSFIYIRLRAGSVKSMLHTAIASRLPIPEPVLRRKIGLGFISPFSPQKEKEGLVLDYG
jgi:hypothetical protein